MFRMLSVEFILLLILGFSLGTVLFLYWSARSELSEMDQGKQKVDKKMLDHVSETKTLQFKNSLLQSDVDRLKEDAVRASELSDQITELQKLLVGVLKSC